MKVSKLSSSIFFLTITGIIFYNLINKKSTNVQESKPYLHKKNHTTDSITLNKLAKKASDLARARDLDSAIYYSHQLKNKAVFLRDTSFLAKSHNKLGLYYSKSNQPIEAFENFNESKKYYISLKDSTQAGKMALNQSLIQKNLSDYLGSEKTAITALNYLKTPEDKKFIASAYNVLATNSKNQNNYKEAIYWYEKAIKETENSYDTFLFKNNLALTYLDLKEYNKAIDLLTELSKNYAKDTGLNDNLIYAMWLENSSFNPTTGLLRNLDIHLNQNNIYGSIDSYILLAKYNRDKDYTKTVSYALKALESSRKIKNIEGELTALRFLIDIKYFEKEYDFVENYLKITDSINSASLKAKNQFAKIKYDTDKTRDVNLTLNTKIAKDRLRIAKETYRRNIGILISSLLVISVIFIILTWRQRIKIASFNATTKTETRISKKVHDEMANDISNIKTLIKNHIPNTIPVKKQLLNMLDHSYLNARDIASETGDVIFSNLFGDDLKTLLMQHNNENVKIITNLKALNSLKTDKHRKVAIYRILQELMVNMNKHSYATRVTIAHKQQGKYHEINYRDNGVGKSMITKNNGLKNASSRMKDINGTFKFETSDGQGFKALLKFKA